MKINKIINLILALSLILTMSACAGEGGDETTKAPESDDNDFDEPEENASLWGLIVAIVVVIAIIGVVVMLIPKKRK